MADGPILFYGVRDEFGCFSNFAPAPIRLKDRVWPTAEHYFQAQKFAGTSHKEEIRQAASPMIAARPSRSRRRPLCRDWESAKEGVMLEALRAKFSQHEDLKKVLLETGKRQLVEHTRHDWYWADGGDGSGRNRLGELLMLARAEFQGSRV
jgi:ribA/ribD-fused uncharacterized protein